MQLIWEVTDKKIYYMGESSKFPKSWTFEIQNLKQAVRLQNNIKWKKSISNAY